MKADSHYIYIVDDSKVSLKILQKRIQDITRYKVRTFDSAEDFLRMFSVRKPELILADLHLNSESPENMNGDKLLRIVRKLAPGIPVIIYSSSNSLKQIIHLVRDGAKSFIPRDQNFLREISNATLHELIALNEPHNTFNLKRSILSGSMVLAGMIALDSFLWKKTFPWISIIAFLLIASWITQRCTRYMLNKTNHKI